MTPAAELSTQQPANALRRGGTPRRKASRHAGPERFRLDLAGPAVLIGVVMDAMTSPSSDVENFDRALNAAQIAVLQDTQIGIGYVYGEVVQALGGVPDDSTERGFHQFEWRLHQLANIANLAALTMRRIRADPGRIAEITAQATQMLNWFRSRAVQGPPQDQLPPYPILSIGTDGDPEELWTNLTNTMLGDMTFGQE